MITLALFFSLLCSALTGWYVTREMRRTYRRDMRSLLDAVKPAIRHNRSQPAIDRAAEAVRTFEEANE